MRGLDRELAREHTGQKNKLNRPGPMPADLRRKFTRVLGWDGVRATTINQKNDQGWVGGWAGVVGGVVLCARGVAGPTVHWCVGPEVRDI